MHSCRVFAIAATALLTVFSGAAQGFPTMGPVTELFGPGDFTGLSTVIRFDDAADGADARTRYLAQGVEFQNTGAWVPIRNETILDPPGVTTSPPNTVTTQDGINGSEFSDFLDLLFTSPTLEVGAYFGNDQGLQPTLNMKLTVFDALDVEIGYVLVDANENVDIDQFAGLRSAAPFPFYRARFENYLAAPDISISLDDVQFTTPVPEPSSLVLLGCGLGVMARLRRRK